MSEHDAEEFDYYEELKVPETADVDQLKEAYRTLSMECHPDLNRPEAGFTEEEAGEAERRQRRLNEAYETFSDPERRAGYDAERQTRALVARNDTDGLVRPVRLDDFIGQRVICDTLRIEIDDAIQQQTAVRHVLLEGPWGLGKSTLAEIVAHERGVPLHVINGAILTKDNMSALHQELLDLEPNAVLFIDEIDGMHRAVSYSLNIVMERGQLSYVDRSVPKAERRPRIIRIAPFTLVGATTDRGGLTGPLFDRFKQPLVLEFYDYPAMVEIVERAGLKLSFPLARRAIEQIAGRASGTPRRAVSLVEWAKIYAMRLGKTGDDIGIVMHAINRRVDRNGFDKLSQQYVRKLLVTFDGGPAGLDTMASALFTSPAALRRFVEPWLIYRDYIYIRKEGRIATPALYKAMNMDPPRSRPGTQPPTKRRGPVDGPVQVLKQ
jgi:Holliday junction DNA helicase RuvB